MHTNQAQGAAFVRCQGNFQLWFGKGDGFCHQIDGEVHFQAGIKSWRRIGGVIIDRRTYRVMPRVGDFRVIKQGDFLLGFAGKTFKCFVCTQIKPVCEMFQRGLAGLMVAGVWCLDNQDNIGVNCCQNHRNRFDLAGAGDFVARGPFVINQQRIVVVKQIGKPFDIRPDSQ